MAYIKESDLRKLFNEDCSEIEYYCNMELMPTVGNSANRAEYFERIQQSRVRRAKQRKQVRHSS